jgi:hypothetical protein
MAKKGVSIWRSVTAGIVGDQRVQIPDFPSSRRYARLILVVTLTSAVIALTVSKYLQAGSVRSELTTYRVAFDKASQEEIANGFCPCSSTAIPWDQFMAWGPGVQALIGPESEGDYMQLSAFKFAQCNALVLSNDASYLVNESAVMAENALLSPRVSPSSQMIVADHKLYAKRLLCIRNLHSMITTLETLTTTTVYSSTSLQPDYVVQIAFQTYVGASSAYYD